MKHFLHAGLCLSIASALNSSAHAQVILLEEFDGGESTTGFVIDETNVTDCRWEYAPDSVGPGDFSLDFSGVWPAGPGFDSSFVFLDSDACGGTAVVVNSFITSAPFDASGAGFKMLTFSHQFRARLASFIKVEAYNGATWSEVYTATGADVGYPNPSVITTLNITDALAASPTAQIRFQFSAGWDWWWAVDSIVVQSVSCLFPEDLAASDATTNSAVISWTDNGSAGYEWVVTTGAPPNGTNAVATGTGANTTASGLESGTGYTVFVRAVCGGENSLWSAGVPFTTLITNDGCDTPTAVTANPDMQCGTVTAGTVIGATASNVTSTCFGTADDDVWFNFTATATTHEISLIDITGSTGDMYMALWSGGCANPVLVPNSCSDPQAVSVGGLSIGTEYLLQVYTWTATPEQTSVFNVCVGVNTVGMGELTSLQPIEVYPNPVRDELNVRGLTTQKGLLRVVDVFGRTVLEQRVARTVDVQALTNGTYTMLAFDEVGNTIARTRFVKQ